MGPSTELSGAARLTETPASGMLCANGSAMVRIARRIRPGPRKGRRMPPLEVGIFESIFPRRRFEESLDAVAALGLGWVQFDLASAGVPTVPTEPGAIPPGLTARIRRGAAARGIQIAALAGTYNMVHPNPAVRAAGLAGLRAALGLKLARWHDSPNGVVSRGS